MVTYIIIALTAVISFIAFNNEFILNKCIFHTPSVKNNGWYRFITYGFLHADLAHLFFNMFALFLFGKEIENVFRSSFGDTSGIVFYILMYLSSLAVSILPSYFKHKNDYNYRSLGASGAVSAIVFAYIFIYPMNFLGIMFIPVFLPAFIFGIIYVVVSVILDRKQSGNINHLAHVVGGIYGMAYIIAVFYIFAHFNLLTHFIESIQISSLSDLIHIGYS